MSIGLSVRFYLGVRIMKSVAFTLDGVKYGLYYSGAAMFDIQDMLGDADIFDVLRGRSKEKFEKLAQIVEIMSAQYCAAMHARNPAANAAFLTAENIRAAAAIRDIEMLQRVVMEAINIGLSQEEGDDEIDLGLIEFQKKTAKTRSDAPSMR